MVNRKSICKQRVLFINRSYWPDTEATGQLLTELCEGLADDFEVAVLAGQPNHVQGQVTSVNCGPEYRNQVRVERVLHTRFSKASFIGKAINLVTFTLAAFQATLFRQRPTVVVTKTDPFLLLLLGRWLKWRYLCRLVTYLQDIYPDVAVSVGKIREGLLTKTLRAWIVRACKSADVVVVPGEDMKARCIANGIPAESIRVLHNWADCDRIVPHKSANRFREEQHLADRFVVMYSGNMGMAHLLTPILDVAKQFRQDDRFLFVFVGEGVQKKELMEQARINGLRNVRFCSYQPKEFLAHSLSAADVHLVSVRPEVYDCVMPSKLYGVLASGTAVLALAPLQSEVSQIIREHDLGAVCDPLDDDLAQQIAAQLQKMVDSPERTIQQGERARSVCLERFDRAPQIQRFSDLLSEILNNAEVSPSLGEKANPPETPRKPAPDPNIKAYLN